MIVAGYSMGSIVAQRVWRQHPEQGRRAWCSARPPTGSGSTPRERVFFTGHGASRCSAPAASPGRVRRCTRRASGRRGARPRARPTSTTGRCASSAAPARGRSARRVAALGRHHSRPWLVADRRPDRGRGHHQDRVIPPARQLALARRIPGATIHDIDAGHAAACWSRRGSCRRSSRRSPPSTRGAATSRCADRSRVARSPHHFDGRALRAFSDRRRLACVDAALSSPAPRGSAAPGRRRPASTRGRR